MQGWTNLYDAGVFWGTQNSHFWGDRILRVTDPIVKHGVAEVRYGYVGPPIKTVPKTRCFLEDIPGMSCWYFDLMD